MFQTNVVATFFQVFETSRANEQVTVLFSSS